MTPELRTFADAAAAAEACAACILQLLQSALMGSRKRHCDLRWVNAEADVCGDGEGGLRLEKRSSLLGGSTGRAAQSRTK